MELTKKQLKDRLIDAINLIKKQDKRLFYLKHDMYRMNDTIERLQLQINFDLQTQLSKLKKDKLALNNAGSSNIRCYFVLFYFIFFAVIAISMI